MMNDKIMAILNKDEKAKRMKTIFEAAVKEQGLEGAELEEARKTFMMLVISKNPEAMAAMAEEIWEEVNAN